MQTIDHPTLGTLHLIKRKKQRHIRVSVGAEGQITVSLPTWLPYRAGIVFAESKRDWILKNRDDRITRIVTLEDGMSIGKTYTLVFDGIEEGAVRTRVKASEIVVYIPDHLHHSDSQVQSAAQRACERALQRESELLLPDRVHTLALTHSFSFKSITCKRLKRRWGSCDSARNLVFNTHLMQLPWELIDYVILHELTHTIHMHHQAAFWDTLSSTAPNYKDLRKQLRAYQPSIVLTV